MSKQDRLCCSGCVAQPAPQPASRRTRSLGGGASRLALCGALVLGVAAPFGVLAAPEPESPESGDSSAVLDFAALDLPIACDKLTEEELVAAIDAGLCGLGVLEPAAGPLPPEVVPPGFAPGTSDASDNSPGGGAGGVGAVADGGDPGGSGDGGDGGGGGDGDGGGSGDGDGGGDGDGDGGGSTGGKGNNGLGNGQDPAPRGFDNSLQGDQDDGGTTGKGKNS
jgi:hypothetical protein